MENPSQEQIDTVAKAIAKAMLPQGDVEIVPNDDEDMQHLANDIGVMDSYSNTFWDARTIAAAAIKAMQGAV